MIAERKGLIHLHRLLRRLDQAAAARIAERDRPKIIRALEVRLETGRALTEHLAREPRQPLTGFETVYIGLTPPRSELYRRIDERVQRMFAAGLVDEVRQLLANGIPRSAKAFEAIGYRHVLADLDSCIDREETIRIIQRDTRRYAKRQMTWFRNQPNVTWFNGPGDDEEIKNKVRQFVQPFLKF